ncbi:MAG TPA: hypothetical protein VJ813_13115 [Vicinamibacterales bacterium]|nr:hypothetical protein [Vicinamibacterales bacterium]
MPPTASNLSMRYGPTDEPGVSRGAGRSTSPATSMPTGASIIPACGCPSKDSTSRRSVGSSAHARARNASRSAGVRPRAS